MIDRDVPRTPGPTADRRAGRHRVAIAADGSERLWHQSDIRVDDINVHSDFTPSPRSRRPPPSKTGTLDRRRSSIRSSTSRAWVMRRCLRRRCTRTRRTRDSRTLTKATTPLLVHLALRIARALGGDRRGALRQKGRRGMRSRRTDPPHWSADRRTDRWSRGACRCEIALLEGA